MQDRYASAKIIYDYLVISDQPVKSDAVIGFGHFDMKIPARCAELVMNGYADKIIFTGGVGAGSADLAYPEAIEFHHYLKKHFPEVSKQQVYLEDQSTNTSENVKFTMKLLNDYDLQFGDQIKKVILVASPYRQRRVYLTCIHELPELKFICSPPSSGFDHEIELFLQKGEDLQTLLKGEIDRIIKYPELGYIAPTKVPDEVMKAYEAL